MVRGICPTFLVDPVALRSIIRPVIRWRRTRAKKKLSYGIVAVTPRRDKGELDPAGPNLGFHGNDISSRWP